MDINRVVQVLTAARAPDLATRQPAEQQLKQLAEGNAPMFFAGMATALNKNDLVEDIRQLAGLLMKAALESTNDVLREARAMRWLSIDATVRKQIKNLAVSALASPSSVVSRTAAMAVASIGNIELRTVDDKTKVSQWPELIPGLLTKVDKAHLECLGYLCEELPREYVSQKHTDRILHSITIGMKKEQADVLRKTACAALLNTLAFAKRNMNIPAQCKLIMEAIFSCTECANLDVRVVAYQCLVKIAELYYEPLAPWIPKCYERTIAGITTMEEEAARQALEFWHSLAEEEKDLQDDALAAAAEQKEPEVKCANYCQTALKPLVKVLTGQMCKQSGNSNDDDNWELSMAAGTCLGALALTCPGTILGEVMPFVTDNIASTDWHKREAATLAFGSMMSGPPREMLLPAINRVLPFFLNKLTRGTEDPNVAVRDTTAWTVGRILAEHFPFLDQGKFVLPLINTLTAALLNDEPRVANNCAYGIHNMAAAMSMWEDTKRNLLSDHFQTLVAALLKCAARHDWHENSLRKTAYEALNVMIQYSADDVLHLVMKLTPVLLAQLEASVNHPCATPDDKDEQYGLQICLCGLLQAIMIRVGNQIMPYAAKVFELLMKVFNTKDASAHSEAYMAMGALINSMDASFGQYMGHFFPRLCHGLGSVNEVDVCGVAVGLIGDLCRALEAHMAPYVDSLVQGLLANLKNKMLQRTVKPAMLSSFGDLVLAVGSKFPDAYITPIMEMLVDASKTPMVDDDDAAIDFVEDLRTNVLEGLTSTVQGLNDEADRSKLVHLQRFVPDLALFLANIAADVNRDQTITTAAVALMGDLSHALPHVVAPHINKRVAWVQQLVADCNQSGDEDAMEMAEWTTDLLAP